MKESARYAANALLGVHPASVAIPPGAAVGADTVIE
jgi:hypothetical protein